MQTDTDNTASTDSMRPSGTHLSVSHEYFRAPLQGSFGAAALRNSQPSVEGTPAPRLLRPPSMRRCPDPRLPSGHASVRRLRPRLTFPFYRSYSCPHYSYFYFSSISSFPLPLSATSFVTSPSMPWPSCKTRSTPFLNAACPAICLLLSAL